ncbi:hypothetical protein BIFGAL_02588 [Bifidobacterium gallicum DSM 20093 = LMG 11596]|uniref:Uncharacterized protein n=1 Tax=Bifidobacterium gallicum DSM 20093 = LMG 11596 TaxID=561180 RepID=D1NS35_9BIFI|nr:hypothetical protein BIFGAL_02588 [Bifidobacterium gallicum DSM 20093 = LMG 11596]
MHEAFMIRFMDAADREVLNRALRMNTPIDIRRNRKFANAIMFDAYRGRWL